ncbi:MAG: fibrobacter succinogenes major paralogous domain-containing protein [Fibromonadales bacterium]|nr:fibrobacter succinogenes major paralogous domain-containing protein [Fibromonadales bacterium]
MKTQLAKLALAVALGLAFTLTISCGEHSLDTFIGSLLESSNSKGESENESKNSSSSTAYCSFTGSRDGTFMDSRDGTIYKCVRIDSQIWMAENLNYDVPNNNTDICYNHETARCATYGHLYNWATVMNLAATCNSSNCVTEVQPTHQGICPSGWHIPSNAEWGVLVDYAGGEEVAGGKLKLGSGWNSNIGTDDFGFAALPGGYGGEDGSFGSAGANGRWWSTTEYNAEHAYYRYMSRGGENVYDGRNMVKGDFLSVRCVQDY